MSPKFASIVAKIMVTLMLGAAALLATPAGAGAASDDPPSTLLPPGASAVLGDPVSGRTFVASRESDVVTALDAGGAVVATVTVQDPSSIALHDGSLYVIASATGTISVFTTDALVLVKTLQPSISHPSTLAWAGGALWTSTACNPSYVCLAKVNPVKGTTTVYKPIAGLTYVPRLLASPTDPNALFAWDDFVSPATLVRLDVSSRTPAVRATAQQAGSLMTPAFTPDGTRVLFSAAGEMHELSFATLQSTGRTFWSSGWFGIQPGTGRLAVASDRLWAFEPNAFVPSWNHELEDGLIRVAVVWPAGDSRVQLVTIDGTTGQTRVQILSEPPPIEPTTTVLHGPGGTTGEVTISYGTSLTIQAQVASDTSGTRPTEGTITFTEGSTTLGTADIVDGGASFTVDGLLPGSHAFTASYAGSRTLSPSTSAPLNVRVIDAATTTSLTTSHPTSLPMDNIDFEATVTGPSWALRPTGVVTFYDGDKQIGSATLSIVSGNSARARFSTWEPTLVPGTHRFTAVYSGDQWFSPSQSAPLDHSVLVASAPVITQTM
ncbi:MAG: hypothetical protein QOJ09_2525 [Actinomycetota bacterium]|nr:hypothetical protein [Actinomycetota bacterium]